MLFHQSIMTSYLLLNYHNLSSLKLCSNTALTCKAFSVHSTWKQSRVSFNYKCIICVTLIQRFLTQPQLISWFHITYISLSDSRKHLENQATTSISSNSTELKLYFLHAILLHQKPHRWLLPRNPYFKSHLLHSSGFSLMMECYV